MKILLLGKYGQVGWELQRTLGQLGTLTALGRDEADLTDEQQLRRAVRTVRPSVIVNAAAYTAVDQAERETDLAFQVNARAPKILAEEAAELNGWLVHYSTDYAFDGTKSTPYDEQDEPAPLNAYGRSKVSGEEAIRSTGGNYLIFRCSWIFASRRTNFALSILKQAIDRDSLKVIDDCFGAPTGAPLIADATARALRNMFGEKPRPELSGLYHLAADGVTTWREYAIFLVEGARRLGFPVKLDAARIAGVSEREYAAPAKRPLNSRFDTTKIKCTFGIELPDWQAGVDRFLHDVADPLRPFPSHSETQR